MLTVSGVIKIYMNSIQIPGALRPQSRQAKLLGLLASSALALAVVAADLNHTVSWVGNTFPGGNDLWVQNNVDMMRVSTDGTMYTASEWDEAGRCSGAYKDGKPNLALFKAERGNSAWGWGTAGRAIAVTDEFFFLANKNKHLLRFRRSDNSFVNQVTIGDALAMAYHDGNLFIAMKGGEIQQRKASDGSSVGSFMVADEAQDIAVDIKGTLWLRIGKEIVQYDTTGKKLAGSIKGLEDPSGIAFDNRGRLIVCENGVKRQVFFYDISAEPKIVRTFGTEGGLQAGEPGVVKGQPTKLFDIVGAGTDSEGNLYVAMSRNFCTLRKFTSDGKLVWDATTTCFVDACSFDPTSDGKTIYGRTEIYDYDYDAPPGALAWTLKSFTRDLVKYPHDLRDRKGNGTGWYRTVDGHRLLFTAGQYAGKVDVFYFKPGDDVAIPAGSRGKSWAVWADAKGNVWYADGDQIAMDPLTGFDADGKPQYGPSTRVPRPEEFISVERLIYDNATDRMYLGGFTKDRPDPGGAWGLVGTEILRYDNWQAKPTLHCHMQLPFKTWKGGGSADMIMPSSMDVAGDYAFVVYCWACEGTGNQPPVRIYKVDSGEYVGDLRPGGVVGGSGWVDVPYGVSAIRRSNGEYAVIVEEDYRAKQILYRWRP